MRSFLLSTSTLLEREVIRFIRQKNRIIGALGTPLVFWFLIGSGIGESFQAPDVPLPLMRTEGLSYLQYFFPGTVLLILLFTAIFSTISIIEDRKEGFLQAVLVSPIPRSALVFGKLMGGTLLAVGQGLLFILLAPLLGFSFGFLDFLYLLSILFFLSFGLTGLGFVMAWKLDSTQGFHALMNLFLMPMWLLSGALFPIESGPGWLTKIMMLNPLTYGIAGLQKGFFGAFQSSHSVLFAGGTCFGVCLGFAVVMFAWSVKVSTAPTKD